LPEQGKNQAEQGRRVNQASRANFNLNFKIEKMSFDGMKR